MWTPLSKVWCTTAWISGHFACIPQGTKYPWGRSASLHGPFPCRQRGNLNCSSGEVWGKKKEKEVSSFDNKGEKFPNCEGFWAAAVPFSPHSPDQLLLSIMRFKKAFFLWQELGLFILSSPTLFHFRWLGLLAMRRRDEGREDMKPFAFTSLSRKGWWRWELAISWCLMAQNLQLLALGLQIWTGCRCALLSPLGEGSDPKKSQQQQPRPTCLLPPSTHRQHPLSQWPHKTPRRLRQPPPSFEPLVLTYEKGVNAA